MPSAATFSAILGAALFALAPAAASEPRPASSTGPEAQPQPKSSPSMPVPAKPSVARDPPPPLLPQLGWGSDETMTYSVKLSGIEGGRVAFAVGRPARGRAGHALNLRAMGETVPFFSAFRHMSEEVITLIDLDNKLAPLRSSTDRRGSDQDRRVEAIFSALVTQRIERGGAVQRRLRRISRPCYDPLSALYLLRSIPIRPGVRLELTVLSGLALYRAEVEVKGSERIYTPSPPSSAGTAKRAPGSRPTRPRGSAAGGVPMSAWETLRVEGVARRIRDDGSVIEAQRPRRLAIWLSADQARVPVRVIGDTTLGTVECTLSGYRPPRQRLRPRPLPAGR